MRKGLLLPVILLIAVLAGADKAAAATDNLITSSDVDAILNMAKGYGSATLGKDNQGDPKISGRIDGLSYGIYFYGCKEGANCDSLMFNTGWVKDVKQCTLEDVNKWNQAKRFGHAFIDKDGDVALQMDLHMGFGMTERNLDVYFQRWRSLMQNFQKDVLAPAQ